MGYKFHSVEDIGQFINVAVSSFLSKQQDEIFREGKYEKESESSVARPGVFRSIDAYQIEKTDFHEIYRAPKKKKSALLKDSTRGRSPARNSWKREKRRRKRDGLSIERWYSRKKSGAHEIAKGVSGSLSLHFIDGGAGEKKIVGRHNDAQRVSATYRCTL